MVEAADGGDVAAAFAVQRYQKRPAVEFYDLRVDPLEMHNIATEPSSAAIMAGLQDQLSKWMRSQGDLGVETEMRSNDHKVKTAKNSGGKKSKRSSSDQ